MSESARQAARRTIAEIPQMDDAHLAEMRRHCAKQVRGWRRAARGTDWDAYDTYECWRDVEAAVVAEQRARNGCASRRSISELTVGREMDAAVAKALGYPLDGAIVQVTDKRPVGSGILWSPSTSIADAFAALDAVLVNMPSGTRNSSEVGASRCANGSVRWQSRERRQHGGAVLLPPKQSAGLSWHWRQEMDTDRTRELALVARMEQELALLRKVEQAALTYWRKNSCDSHRYSQDEWDALTDALTDVAFWRDEHAKVTT